MVMLETQLHHNPLIASGQLLFWLLFQPSCWHRYINRYLPNISPDFSLSMLHFNQWSSHLRYLILLSYLILPLLISSIIGLLLNFIGHDNVLQGIIYTAVLHCVSGLLSGTIISVAFSIIASSISSFLIGLLFIFKTISWEKSAILIGLFAISVASNILISLVTQQTKIYLIKQLGSIILGLLISSIILLTSTLLLPYLLVTPNNMTLAQLIGLSIGIGFTFGMYTRRWLWALAMTVIFGIAIYLLIALSINQLNEISRAIIGAITNGLLFPLFFALPYLFVRHIADIWAGTIAGSLGVSSVYITLFVLKQQDILIIPLALSVVILGFTQTQWRSLLLYPIESAWNLFIYRREELKKKSCLRWNAAFWDEYQRIPLYGLEKHLVLVHIRDQQQGQQAIDYISQTSQNWAAQAAQIELDARYLEQCTDLNRIKMAYHQLPIDELFNPISGLLNRFSHISREIEISLARETLYLQRQALIQNITTLSQLLRDMTRIAQPEILRFWQIAETWRHILTEYLQQVTEQIDLEQEIDNPYITGVHLTPNDQQLFVGRRDACARIEHILRDRRNPPILLYGQRRMGKTSLLNHLDRLLPATYVPMFIDLQGPVSASPDHTGFFYHLCRIMQRSAKANRQLILPTITREWLAIDPFGRFDEWLDSVEACCHHCIFLLTLDEFEALAYVFRQGRLDQALILGMFRHMIQHRMHFRILISSAYLLDAFPEFTDYLINVETVELSYLQPDEARQLIEKPIENFLLSYTTEAVERILQFTHCHPALVQLLCKEIVRLKNEQPRQFRELAHIEDVEAAVMPALENGRTFFIHLANRTALEKEILHFLALKGENVTIHFEELHREIPTIKIEMLHILVQQGLLKCSEYGYTFQVELIRRWFI